MNKNSFLEIKDKRNAIITAIFYLLAAITSITALVLYKPLIYDEKYLLLGAVHSQQIIFGVLFELVTAITVAGTAIMLFPYLRKFNESLSLGYFCLRFMEAILILIGTVSVLSLLSLSREYTNNVSLNTEAYHSLGAILKAIHDWLFILGPNFMLGINTFIYSYIFFRTNLIPKKMATLGMVGSVSIFVAALLELFGVIQQVSVWGAVFAIPVFVYEMSLAIWLIIKGFNLQYLAK